MSVTYKETCDGCGRELAPGAVKLGIFIEEERIKDPHRGERRRIRRRRRDEDEMPGVELRSVNADLCGDCLALPVNLAALLDRLVPPRPKCLECNGTGGIDRKKSDNWCDACDGSGFADEHGGALG